MLKHASPLSRSASASHVTSFPLSRTLVGAGGGVVSATFVSLTYCIHAFAIASFGNHPSLRRSPAYSVARTTLVPVSCESHALSVVIAVSAATPLRRVPDAALPCRHTSVRRPSVPTAPMVLSPTPDALISPRDRRGISERLHQSHCADRTTSDNPLSPAARTPATTERNRAF